MAGMTGWYRRDKRRLAGRSQSYHRRPPLVAALCILVASLSFAVQEFDELYHIHELPIQEHFDKVATEISLEALKGEFPISEDGLPSCWFYLGSTRSKHVFMNLIHDPIGILHDPDELVSMGPIQILVYIPRKEAKLKLRRKLTNNTKRWIPFDNIDQILEE